jgi:hypothetical protein
VEIALGWQNSEVIGTGARSNLYVAWTTDNEGLKKSDDL